MCIDREKERESEELIIINYW